MAINVDSVLREETLSLYPGLAEMIDTGFKCLCPTDGMRTLPFVKLDPFIRHVLQAAGQTQLLARISDSEGRLDPNAFPNSVRYAPRYNLSATDLEAVVIILIRESFVKQKDDALAWTGFCTEAVKSQNDKFNSSLQLYPELYFSAIKEHHAATDLAYKVEEDFAKKMSNNETLKADIEAQQMSVIAEMNLQAADNLTQRRELQLEAFVTKVRKLCRKTKVDKKSGLKKMNFTYPMHITPCNAPVCGGAAQIHTKRK